MTNGTQAKTPQTELAWQMYCRETAGSLDVRDYWEDLPEKVKAVYLAKATCKYPNCNCPFDAPGDPNWCARGLPHSSQEITRHP